MILLVLSLALSSVSGAPNLPPAGQGYGGEFRVTYKNEHKSYNTYIRDDFGAESIDNEIMSRLVVCDWGILQGEPKATNGIVPDLAYKWEHSADGLTYTFYLVENATWSDGVPLTAADVVYTYMTVINNATLQRSTWFRNTMGVTKIEAPNNYTVVFTLKKSNNDWITMLARYGDWEIIILPKHIYDVPGKSWDEIAVEQSSNPVTSGPFLVEEWSKGNYIKFKKNPNYYWSQYPYADRVTMRFIQDPTTAFQALKAGEVDYIHYETVPALAEVQAVNGTLQGIELRTGPAECSYDLYMQHLTANGTSPHPILSNQEVRLAIAYAVNRKAMSTIGFFGLWPDNNGNWGNQYNPWMNQSIRAPDYNKTMAETLLGEAGYPKLGDGWRFELRLFAYQRGALDTMAEMVKENLEAVGIKIKYEIYDYNTAWQKMYAFDWDLMTRHVRYAPAADDGYGGYFHTRNTTISRGQDNWSGWGNATYDQIVDEAMFNTNLTVDQRKALYSKAQEILNQQMPIVPLLYEQKLTLVNKKWHGIVATNEGAGVSQTMIGHRSAWSEDYVTGPSPEVSQPDYTVWYIAGGISAVVILGGAGMYFMRRRKK